VKAKAKTKAKAKVKTRAVVRTVKPAANRPAVRAGAGAASRSNGSRPSAGRDGTAAKLIGGEAVRSLGAQDASGARGASSLALGSFGLEAGMAASTAAPKSRQGRDRLRGVVPGPEAARPEPPPLPTPIASFTL
jgi:hypothetical protein